MAQKLRRPFLARAMEALAERYPRQKATQERLAKLLGVKQPSVSEYGELGRFPSNEKVVQLAMDLGVCVDWLYTERGPKHPTGSLEADQSMFPILEAWPDLDESKRRQVARYTEFVRDDPVK